MSTRKKHATVMSREGFLRREEDDKEALRRARSIRRNMQKFMSEGATYDEAVYDAFVGLIFAAENVRPHELREPEVSTKEVQAIVNRLTALVSDRSFPAATRLLLNELFVALDYVRSSKVRKEWPPPKVGGVLLNSVIPVARPRGRR